MQSASKEEIAMDSLLEDPFASLRTYQSTMTEMCNCLLSRPNIVNKNYRDLTEKSFKTRAEVIEAAKRAEAIALLDETSKRVKKGTHDADVINFIMDNQTTSTALAPLSEGEKNLIQELYRMIENKSGNIKFDLFWRRFRNCFDEEDSLEQDKVTHHAMVAFKKPVGKYQPTIDKRTQLTGKAGLRRANARRTIQNLLLTIIGMLRTSGSMIYFRSWGS